MSQLKNSEQTLTPQNSHHNNDSIPTYNSIHRKPVMANSSVIITAKLNEAKGRKLFMSATMRSPDGDILVESTALFITMQKEQDPPSNSQ